MEKRWKSICIAFVLFAILITFFGGISSIVKASKVEKEPVKVETQVKTELDLVKDFFYYFSYDKNLERFIAKRKNKLDKVRAEYQEVAQHLEMAKQSGDFTQVIKYNIKLKNVKEDLAFAQDDYDHLEEFDTGWSVMVRAFWVLIGLMVFCLWFAGFSRPVPVFSIWVSYFIVALFIAAIWNSMVSWASLVAIFLLVCYFSGVFLFNQKRKVGSEHK